MDTPPKYMFSLFIVVYTVICMYHQHQQFLHKGPFFFIVVFSLWYVCQMYTWLIPNEIICPFNYQMSKRYIGTAQAIFAVVLCDGATKSHVTGSDVSHVTGRDVSPWPDVTSITGNGSMLSALVWPFDRKWRQSRDRKRPCPEVCSAHAQPEVAQYPP